MFSSVGYLVLSCIFTLLGHVDCSLFTAEEWCVDKVGLKHDVCRTDPGCSCYCTSWGSGGAHLAYFGEFGYDIVLNLPYAYHLHMRGLLNSTTGPIGSKHYYYFSPKHTELDLPRKWCKGPQPHMPLHTPKFNFEQWAPPPFKDVYKTETLQFKKPLVIIHNKYSKEWQHGPTNFIDVQTLRKLFMMLTNKFTVVYLRPTPSNVKQYGWDQQVYPAPSNEDLQDGKLLEDFPHVLSIERLSQQYPYGYNELQLRLHAMCERFVSVQGGTSYLASYFGGKNIIFARKGFELSPKMPAYTNIAPHLSNATLFVVKDYDQLLIRVRAEYLNVGA